MTSGRPLDPSARAWLLAGLAGLLLTILAGLWAGGLLAFGYLLPEGAASQFGRIRPIHTRLAFHLWLLPCALGVIRARLPVPGAAPWEVWLAPTWTLLQLAACAQVLAQGVMGPPYAEVHTAFDLASAGVLVAAAVPLVRALRQGGSGHGGTGLLYAAELLVWSVGLTLFVRLVLPLYDGAAAAALHRAWLADSIGMIVTPAAAAAAYLSLRSVTGGDSRRPLIGRIGFYSLALTYVLAGGRHALFGPQDATVERLGWLSSVAIGVPSVALAWNLLESVLRGRSPTRAHRSAAAWLFLGAALWTLLALQGMAQSLPAVNALVSKTDWVAGHAHLAMLGAVGGLVMGGVQGVLADTGRAPVRTSGILRVCWLVASLGMVWALSERGLREVQANLDGVPWATRFGEIQGMWHMRLSAGLVLAVGTLCWLGPATRALISARRAARDESEVDARGSPLLGRAVFAVLVGGASFAFVVSASPGASEPAPTHPGRAVFEREGCVHCHTMAPRRLALDTSPYGDALPPDASPAVPGTRRIGPDLARVGSRRGRSWILAHLRGPTRADEAAGHAAVPKSVMPAYGGLPAADLDALADWLAGLR